MRRLILILLFSGCVFGLNAKIIIQKATYTMGDDDSKTSARNKAILKAKRDSIEQAGVYVSSYSEFSDDKLYDTIKSFSGSIMKVTILNEKFSYPKYFVKIKSNINIKLLNQKLRQFAKSGVNVDDQISSVQNEIEEYNKRLNKLIKDRSKKQELKKLQEKKKRLIRKVNNLANNKPIGLKIIKNRNYGYITVTSNVKDAEIYIDGKYVGYAPIKRFKIPSGKDIELKAVADKRYYNDVIKTINIKRLTRPKFNLELGGLTEIYLVGEEDGYLFVNDKFIKFLTEDDSTAKVDAGNKVKIAIVDKSYSKIFTTTNDLYANNLYEIEYEMVESKQILKKYTQKLDKYFIWTDKNTNLMWQILIDKKVYNWQNAKRYCSNLSLSGYDDWRLPTIKELKTILTKESYKNPKSWSGETYIKKPLLKSMNMEDQWFWSSTKYNSSGAWVVDFVGGGDDYGGVSYAYYVRCVREGSDSY